MFEQKIKLSELIKNKWKNINIKGQFRSDWKNGVFLFLVVYSYNLRYSYYFSVFHNINKAHNPE